MSISPQRGQPTWPRLVPSVQNAGHIPTDNGNFAYIDGHVKTARWSGVAYPGTTGSGWYWDLRSVSAPANNPPAP